MTDLSDRPSRTKSLRQRSEEVADENTTRSAEYPEVQSPEDLRKLLNEMRLRQIELELQNEELRQTEKALKIAQTQYRDINNLTPEMRFRELFNKTFNGVAIYQALNDGADFVIKDINEAGEQISNVKRDAVVGRTVLEVFPAVRDIGLLSTFHRVWKTGIAESHPVSIYKDDRIFHYVQNHIFKLPSGEIVAVYEDVTEREQAKDSLSRSYADLEARVEERTAELAAANAALTNEITERKRMEKELESSYSLMKAAFESTADGLLVVDNHGKMLQLNQKFVDLWRIPKAIKESRDDNEALAFVVDQLQDAEKFLDLVKELYAHPDADSFDTLEFKDGRIFERYSRPQKIKGECVGRVWSFRDVTERRQAEAALKKSETLYHDLVETSQDLIWQCDTSGRYIYLNPAWEQVFGYQVEEMLGKKFSAFQTPEYSDKDLKEFARLLNGNSVKGLETVHIGKDGREIHLVFNAKIIVDERGNPAGTRGTAYDITERKRVEMALMESEETFRSIFNASPMGIHLYQLEKDDRLVFIGANPAADKLLRVDNSAFIGKTIEEAFPPLLNTEIPDRYRRAARHGEGWCIEQVNYDENNIAGAFEVHVFQMSPGKTAVLFNDITKRKQIETALKDNEERFRNLFEHHSAIKLLIDPVHGDIIDANTAAIGYYGWSRAQLLQMRIQDINTLSPEEIKVEMEKAALNQRIHFEFRHRRADGSIRDVEVFSSKINDQGKTLLHSIVHDITERKQAEAEKANLETLNLQLHKNQSLHRMAGAIAHHFNNQLGVVMGNLELAMDDLPGNSPQAKRLKGAMQGAQKAAEVSSQMLTFLGQTTGKHLPLDVSEVCRQILPLLQAATPSGVMFKTDFPVPGPQITGNANQLQQVLTNLVTNAFEAIGENQGEIHILVKKVSLADIPKVSRTPVGWQPQDEVYACMEVEDTGCGIADINIANLFDPFFSSKFQGRGLGLSVVLGIVTAHGGCVTVQSAMGQGSIFRVFLPVSFERIAQPPAEKIMPLALAEVGRGVLLVDDEELVRAMAANMLSLCGFAVTVASDGVEAVEIFQKHSNTFSVVLCDLSMPRMDGWETLAALRQIRPDIPVVLASGHDESTVFIRDREELPQAFLHKPYSKSALLESLGKALGSILSGKE